MKIKLVLTTATALSVLLGATAFAANNNEAYTAQDGDNNVLTIQQGAGPGGNRVGTSAAPILQQGNLNSFSETQSTGGGFSKGNNVINAGLQQGNSNSFSSNYSNNTGSNLISIVNQLGNGNKASVGRNGTPVIGSIVGTIRQEGNSNFLTIVQDGGPTNTVTIARQIGSNNGWSLVNAGNKGTLIEQHGTNNLIEESSIYGSNNNAAYGTNPVHQIKQTGVNNGDDSAVAITYGSNGNFIHVTQNGNGNDFDLRQGLTVASTQNFITLDQVGTDNAATVTQYGSYNTVRVNQNGVDNTASALITGDHNGGALFGNAGASALASANGLLSGDITQFGDDQNVALTITSSGNQFAFKQSGGNGNTITATIGGNNGNQAVGIQNGNDNTATLAQTGATNAAVFNQIGGSNNTTITQ